MSEAKFDVPAAHKWFAIQFNNAAWDLVEAGSRSAQETEEMLHLAHAACLHWSAVGTPVNRLRGLVLLAMAYALAGYGRPAVAFAQSAAELGEAILEDCAPFDRASVAVAMACSCRSAGDADGSAKWSQKARDLAGQLADPDEARVVEQLLALGSAG